LINNKVIIDLIKEGHKVYSDASDAWPLIETAIHETHKQKGINYLPDCDICKR
jgi:hypothetical protein